MTCIVALLAATGFGLHRAFTMVRESSKLKAMLPRQPASGIDQFFLEFEDRIFLTYGELVGPEAFIKAYNAVDGEDLSVQFPVRRDWCNPTRVRLPDGAIVERCEVLAAIGRSGLIITYPQPQEGGYDPKRVYRLDCGVSFRGFHVVDLPPDPAGREGRDQNGIHTYQLHDGRRFEITYRGGVPDGPFRAFYADGSRWGEATYRQGRVVDAWIFTRLGRRFDELNDGPAACKALMAEAKASAEELTRRGRMKMAARDHAGAMADFTGALKSYASAEVYLDRADARLASGDLDGAMADCTQAVHCARTEIERRRAEQKRRDISQRKESR